jgi:hypothetical protein
MDSLELCCGLVLGRVCVFVRVQVSKLSLGRN